MEVLLTENQAQIEIRLNIIKYCFCTYWEMKQRETLTNEQAGEGEGPRDYKLAIKFRLI